MKEREMALPSDQKALLEARFHKDQGRVREEEVDEVLQRVEGHLRSLAKVPGERGRLLVLRLRLMADLLRAWRGGKAELPWRAVTALGATLGYLCDPLDVIPDFLPVVGYLDDLFMVELCLASAGEHLREYALARGEAPETYGL